MPAEARVDPWWAALTVWGVVNAVNVLQAAGFLSRVATGSRTTNHLLGYVIVALALPALVALIAFVRGSAGWLQWAGPAVYIAFVLFMAAVEYVWPVEFRSPARPGILVPYLLLFFRGDPAHGAADVPHGSGTVAPHRGHHGPTAGGDGRRHARRCRLSRCQNPRVVVE
jgi:hypothetical protein